MAKIISRLRQSSYFDLLCLALLPLLWGYATYAHLYFGAYDAKIALEGWSALDFANTVLYPENFIRDYPGGSWTSGKSLIPWLYPGLSLIGVPLEFTLVALVMLEIVTLTVGAMYLMKTLFQDALPAALLSLSTLVSLSWVLEPDLANFGNPFFHGQFYGYADGIGLAAIAFYLRSRYQFSASFLAFGFAVHPLKALYTAVFIGGMHGLSRRSMFSVKVIVPYAAFIVFAVIWAFLWFGLNGATLTQNEFFRFSPLLNSHWYPQDIYIFDRRHGYHATPFLAAMLTGLSVLLRSELSRERKFQILFGMISLAMLSIIGLMVAYFELFPVVVKACFQRATVLMLIVVCMLLLGQTFRDMLSRRWWFGALGVCLLVSAFFGRDAVWPELFALVYAFSSFLGDRSVRQDSVWLLGLGLVVLLVGYQIWLYFSGYQPLSAWNQQLRWLAGVSIVVAFIFKFKHGRLGGVISGILPVVTVFIMAYGAYYWASHNRVCKPALVEKGRAYKAVQIWAREHTPETALFMVDPCTTYGWRDYSRRSSYGSVQEWYKTGWLYTGDQQALHEGIRRGARLGIDLDALVPPGTRPVRSEVHRRLCETARQAFYRSDGEIVADIAADYHVQYVVMDKEPAKQYGPMPKWPTVYENNYYAVLVPVAQMETPHGKS